MMNIRWLIGSGLLAGVLIFGAYGVVINVKAGEQNPYVRDTTYIEECGACHLAYAPGLLPEKSWTGIMQGLADHFGENAELDAETSAYIADYLARYALKGGHPSRISQFLRNMPEAPPLRITLLPGFIAAHDIVRERLELDEFAEGFLSPCVDCHRTANSAVFDKELLRPGYGPKIWGAPKP